MVSAAWFRVRRVDVGPPAALSVSRAVPAPATDPLRLATVWLELNSTEELTLRSTAALLSAPAAVTTRLPALTSMGPKTGLFPERVRVPVPPLANRGGERAADEQPTGPIDVPGALLGKTDTGGDGLRAG